MRAIPSNCPGSCRGTESCSESASRRRLGAEVMTGSGMKGSGVIGKRSDNCFQETDSSSRSTISKSEDSEESQNAP